MGMNNYKFAAQLMAKGICDFSPLSRPELLFRLSNFNLDSRRAFGYFLQLCFLLALSFGVLESKCWSQTQQIDDQRIPTKSKFAINYWIVEGKGLETNKGVPVIKGTYIVRQIGQPTFIFQFSKLKKNGDYIVPFIFVIDDKKAFRTLAKVGVSHLGSSDAFTGFSFLDNANVPSKFCYTLDIWASDTPPVDFLESFEAELIVNEREHLTEFDLSNGRVFVSSKNREDDSLVIQQFSVDTLSQRQISEFLEPPLEMLVGTPVDKVRAGMLADWWKEFKESKSQAVKTIDQNFMSGKKDK